MGWWLLVVIVLAPVLADGHEVFWESVDGAWVLMEGHRPGREHDGERAAPLDPERIDSQHSGTCTDGGMRWEKSAPSPGSQALFAAIDWGWWSKTATGTRNVHPDSAPGVLTAWRSDETVKHLVEPCSPGHEVVGIGLEITPAAALTDLETGDKSTLLVTLDGRPARDVTVAYGGRGRGTTASDGTIRLKLRASGLQVITATLRRPVPGKDWAEDVRSATLTFNLEEKP